jgi:hypothetical protein
MLRVRLPLDCGFAAVATQGVSDNLFTIESPPRYKKDFSVLRRPEFCYV